MIQRERLVQVEHAEEPHEGRQREEGQRDHRHQREDADDKGEGRPLERPKRELTRADLAGYRGVLVVPRVPQLQEDEW